MRLHVMTQGQEPGAQKEHVVNNFGKLIIGALLSVGIATVASKVTDQKVVHPDEPRESLRERISRAGDTASVARVAEEERLRNQFRARTGDPLAFVPSAIPAVPTGTNGGAA